MGVIIRIAWVAMLGLALAAQANEEGDRFGDAGKRTTFDASADRGGVASRKVVYVPPTGDSTRARTGGDTPGSTTAPTLAVLAPDHVGITWRAQPTLAWWVSDATSAHIEFTLIDLDEVEPVLEVTLPGPYDAGIHLLRLADHGVRLEPGRSYDWSVALLAEGEDRELDVVAGGAIRRESPEPEVVARVAAGMPSHVALAGAGVWYDAIGELSEAIAAQPADADLRADRASLLEQVGVAAAVAFERRSGRPAVESGME